MVEDVKQIYVCTANKGIFRSPACDSLRLLEDTKTISSHVAMTQAVLQTRWFSFVSYG